MTSERKAERISRVFPPLKPDHWAIGVQCAICGKPLNVGDETALVACATTSAFFGDAPPREANVRALVAHESCTT